MVGAGTMGLGVAECFAAAGIRVVLTDATPELTREAKARLVRRARGHAELVTDPVRKSSQIH